MLEAKQQDVGLAKCGLNAFLSFLPVRVAVREWGTSWVPEPQQWERSAQSAR